MMDSVVSNYESEAATNGEIRLYLHTAGPLDPQRVQALLGYSYTYQKQHRNPVDPWENLLAVARRLFAESQFLEERDHVISTIVAEVAGEWDADLLYYPPGCSEALYHWSSTEGILHPYKLRELLGRDSD